MQPSFEPPQSQSPHEQETDQKQTDSILSHHFNNISLQTSDSQIPYQDPEEHENYDEDEEEEDDDFSFATFGSNSSPISADDVFKDGQIRPTYPLFNQNLFVSDDDFITSDNRLPLRPAVDKVFIEAPTSSSSYTAKAGDLGGIAAGPYCAWSKSPELSKKSNSTGFSKLWRFKDYMHRSHSDGRDAFVFLNNNNNNSESMTTAKKEEKVVQNKSTESNGVVGEKKKVKKVVKKALSAHEVYLRNKGYSAEEDKRRSYLPYRPELVGFFTNVRGGGLTKNVHPY